MSKFAVIVASYVSDRAQRFCKNLESVPFGDVDYDLYFVHNTIENSEVTNRWEPRTPQEINEVSETLRAYKGKKTIIERENVGEDVGAYRYAYLKLKHNYKYMFFVNEVCTIHKPGWLKGFYDFYEEHPDVVATTPQMCTGHKYPYALPTTYWSLRSSFELEWPEPRSRDDAQIQEMELVWPQANAQNKKLGQVGDGHWFSYKNQTCFSEGVYA